jgi:polyribonucleotide nucleotidyltransferase
MLEKLVYEFELSGSKFRIEANEIGFHAQSALLVSYGETSVYITFSVGKNDPNLDFFPLSIDYVEKLYASGIISSSPYIKREGRPTDHEILSGRLIDHAIRSLFHPDFKNETQVIVQVMAYDKVHDPVLAAIIGTSFALKYSGLPFLHPYGATKVAYINNEIVLNPTQEKAEKSMLEMYVSSTDKGIVSVEAESHNLSDEIIKEAIKKAVELNKALIAEQEKFTSQFGSKSFEFKLDEARNNALQELNDFVSENFSGAIENSLYKIEKMERLAGLEAVFASLTEKYASLIKEGVYTETDLRNAIEKISKKIVRKNILENQKRLDGRKIDEIRPLSMRTGILPRVHGSALFTRGETQSLTVVTLGTDRDAQSLQGLEGESTKKYLHHYNMPGFANGEVDRKFGFPNRRAIGHGAIGEKSLKNLLPAEEEFPYTIRVVSEIVSSNGSTSMAATCASTLALMDAGVKIKDVVGGVGIGLVYEDDGNYKVLTDIIGMEDFYGDMDFKLTGTKTGITAIQLDNKMSGIPEDIFFEAMDRSKVGRIFVLEKMNECISEPRAEISKYAPQVKTIKINPEKIGELIGPGGKTIRSITEKTGVEINIEEDGRVMIYSEDGDKFAEALAMVTGIVQELEPGMEFDAVVVRVEGYGVFIEVPNTKIQGMIHVSELGRGRVEDVREIIKVGEPIKARFMGRDEKGRTKFIAVTEEKS